MRAYFDEWIAFYQDFYQFPADIPVTFSYGFDSYKLTYCTVDAGDAARGQMVPVAGLIRLEPSPYSPRSACIGSTDDARCAGM